MSDFLFFIKKCFFKRTHTNQSLNVFVFFALLFFSCSPSDNPLDESTPSKNGTDFLSFQLKDEVGNLYSPIFPINDTIIHIKIPAESNCRFIPVFSVNGGVVIDNKTGEEVLSDNTTFDYSDFINPRSYRIVSSSGDEKSYIVVLYDLPVLVLNTTDGQSINSKEERVEGCKLLLIDDQGIVNDLGTAGVRGRGNSTWEQPKKPYNIKLDAKKSILGMKASKHWLLLSQPFYDRTQLHNITAFEMAHLSDYKWSQEGTFVELILNGKHEGLYLLCEKIRVEKGKIDISDTADGNNNIPVCLLESYTCPYNDETSLIPDYCFSTDYFNVTGPWWIKMKLGWEVKYPEDDSLKGYENILSSLNAAEALLSDDTSIASGTYRTCFDLSSFADWWIIEESVANMEASKSKNIYMYLDDSGLWKMGPPWDFDAYSFGQYGDKFT